LAPKLRNPLVWDEPRGIWRLPSSATIDYRESTEHHLREVLSRARDLAWDSPELERHIRNWASRYHLSPLRALLLAGFDVDPSASVLEVGAGCGAITRYLGETFDRVTAVEGSLARAELARLRTRDLPGVEVIGAPFQDLELEERFDLVLCIGVLEYAGRFLDGPEPFDRFLGLLRRACADSGTLALAIENQFGLKYFAGAPEDHTGIPYDGLEGYPSRLGPFASTFGRARLESKLRAAGFGELRFFLPFPDYKLPRALLCDSACSRTPAAAFGALIERLVDSRGGKLRGDVFDPGLTLAALAENGLLGVFANSFLVLASPQGEPRALRAGWDAVYFSTSRAPHLRTRTRFFALGRSGGYVEKEPLSPKRAGSPGPSLLEQRTGRSDWIDGERLDLWLTRLLRAREGEWSGWLDALRPWLAMLESLRRPGEDRVPGELIDAVPHNLIRRADGSLARFDDEWVWHEPLPLRVLFARGLYHLLSGLDRSRLRVLAGRGWLVRDVILRAGRALCPPFGPAELHALVELETALQVAVTGGDPARARRSVRRRLARPFDRPAALARRPDRLLRMLVHRTWHAR
jgi:SAM-dependent methyltransferase